MNDLIEAITDMIHHRKIDLEKVTEVSTGHHFVKFKHDDKEYLITILESKKEEKA